MASQASATAIDSVVRKMAPGIAEKALKMQVLRSSLEFSQGLGNQVYLQSVKVCRQIVNQTERSLAQKALHKFGMSLSQSHNVDRILREAVASEFGKQQVWSQILTGASEVTFDVEKSKLRSTVWDSITKAQASGKSIEAAGRRSATANALKVITASIPGAVSTIQQKLESNVAPAVNHVAFELSDQSNADQHSVEQEVQAGLDSEEQFSKDELNRSDILRLESQNHTFDESPWKPYGPPPRKKVIAGGPQNSEELEHTRLFS